MSSGITKLHDLVSREFSQVNDLLLSVAENHLTGDYLFHISNRLIRAKSKRLRPLLTLTLAKGINLFKNEHVFLAAAVELIHTATLLHDDVVDAGQKRRNLLAAHLIWGNKASILVGDYLFSRSFEYMVNTNSLKVLQILSKCSSTIAATEVKQLEMIGDFSITLNDYIELIIGKTAILFAVACSSAMVVANESSGIEESAYSFGLNLGIAFQIIDDIQDCFSSSSEISKESLQDLYEKKVTLPIIILKEELNIEEQKKLKEVFSQGDVREMLELLRQGDAEAKSYNYAKLYLKKAIDSLNNITSLNEEYKQNLKILVNDLLHAKH